jgi:anthranilate phosphoribosyltransferase
MNAALALVAVDRAKTPKDAILLAAEIINSGRALEKFNALRDLTNR